MTSDRRPWLIACAVFLAVEAGLVAHTVLELGLQRYPSIDLVPDWLLFAVDHVTFVGIGSAALFGAIAALSPPPGGASDAPAAGALALGMAGMTVGVGIESRALETASGVVLGLALLVAAATAARRLRMAQRGSGNITSSEPLT